MSTFSPFCFAGLNGSGKSNVLEALASIFFHLECCVAKFKPKNFEINFRPEECNPDSYTLEYLIGLHNNAYVLQNFQKITIKKEEGKAPKLFKQSYPFSKNEKITKESLIPSKRKNSQESAPGKIYLPDLIVGYSSGENEILSLPFRKSRLLNFDKYNEDYTKQRRFEEPENSLIYIDSEMSQAVLLACLLYEDEATLDPIKKELGITGIKSFRMNLQFQELYLDDESGKSINALQHIFNLIEDLKKCTTSWQQFDTDKLNSDKTTGTCLIMDFFVDKFTKEGLKKLFPSSLELFRFFQVLYELNAYQISDKVKEDVYKSKGFYTDWKLPEASPEDKVFYFEDFYITKIIEEETEPKDLLLREFSDGEHQFLHTMGICLMLKNRRSLLLLDEPETHFNPSWRAKFIKILGDSITSGNSNDNINGNFNIHLLKDVLLTSHSPFIISDCMPDNVLFFKRDVQTKKIEAKKASQLGLNTYGSSVDYILTSFFNTNLISSKSYSELKEIIDNGSLEELHNAIEHFGESSKKQYLFKKIYEKMELTDDSKD